MTFKIFFQLPSSCFQKVIRPKNGQKGHFWPIIFFFKKSYLENGASYGKSRKYILQAKYSKLAISAIRKALRRPEGAFLRQFFLLKKGLSSPNGDQTKKYISNFVQNFILIMIKIESKLAGKVLDGNPYFPVYWVMNLL